MIRTPVFSLAALLALSCVKATPLPKDLRAVPSVPPMLQRHVAEHTVRKLTPDQRQQLANALPADLETAELQRSFLTAARKVAGVMPSPPSTGAALPLDVALVEVVTGRAESLRPQFIAEAQGVVRLVEQRDAQLEAMVAATIARLRTVDPTRYRGLIESHGATLAAADLAGVDQALSRAVATSETQAREHLSRARSEISLVVDKTARRTLAQGEDSLRRALRPVQVDAAAKTILQLHAAASGVTHVLAVIRDAQSATVAHQELVLAAGKAFIDSAVGGRIDAIVNGPVADKVRRGQVVLGEIHRLRQLLEQTADPKLQRDIIERRILPQLPAAERTSLQQRLRATPMLVSAEKVASDVAQAAQAVATIATAVGLPPSTARKVSNTAAIASKAIGIASSLLSGNYLGGLASVTGLFGGGGSQSDPRLDQILGKLDEVLAGQQRIIELQQQILVNQQKILDGIANLSRQLDAHHADLVSRIQELADYQRMSGLIANETNRFEYDKCERFFGNRITEAGFSPRLDRFLDETRAASYLEDFWEDFAGCRTGLGKLFISGAPGAGGTPSAVFLGANELFSNSDAGKAYARFFNGVYVPTREVTLALSPFARPGLTVRALSEPWERLGAPGREEKSRAGSPGHATFQQAVTNTVGVELPARGLLEHPIYAPALDPAARYTRGIAEYLQTTHRDSSSRLVLCKANEVRAGGRCGNPNGAVALLRDLLLLTRVAIAQQNLISGEVVLHPLLEVLTARGKRNDGETNRQHWARFNDARAAVARDLLARHAQDAQPVKHCRTGDRYFDAACLLARNGYVSQNLALFAIRDRLARKVGGAPAAPYRVALRDGREGAGLDALLADLDLRNLAAEGQQPRWVWRVVGPDGNYLDLPLPTPELVEAGLIVRPPDYAPLRLIEAATVSQLALFELHTTAPPDLQQELTATIVRDALYAEDQLCNSANPEERAWLQCPPP